MQIQLPAYAKYTGQKNTFSQPSAQILADFPATFDGPGKKTTQLKTLQAMMSDSPHSQNMRSLQAKMHTATQLKTKISHSTADFSYAEGKKDKVGVAMEAWLDPRDPIKGSETGEPQKALYDAVAAKAKTGSNGTVRGHLLNHDLGGYGVAENLYPITKSANTQHKNHVENPVQQELDIAANGTTSEQYNKGEGKGIYYQVEVGNAQFDVDSLVAKPVSFICTAKKLMSVGPGKNGTQSDTLFSTTVVSDTGGATPAKRGSAHKTGSPNEKPERKLSEKIVPQGWEHGNRKGKENFEEKVNDGSIVTLNKTEINKVNALISGLQDQLKSLPQDRYSSAYEPAIKKAKDAMDGLRSEWSGTELNTKKEVASGILQLLDNYLMKVYGRRPSQAVMVQEMGFTI